MSTPTVCILTQTRDQLAAAEMNEHPARMVSQPGSSTSRKAIIDAASRVGEASNDLLIHVMRDRGNETAPETTSMYILTEEERIYQVSESI